MKLKPRAARRLLLLGVVVLLLIVGAVGLIGVRSWQKERRSQKLRDEGMAAFQKKDDYGTVSNLGQFLRRKPDDREAWLTFAEARERIEEPSGQHLQQTLLAYSRAWALDESDETVGRKLLKLYNMIGQYPEARDLAMRLRPKNPSEAGPDSADVLREEATARIALKAFDATLDAITERLRVLQPDAYQPAYLRTSYLINAKRTDDATAFVNSLVAASPDDPRAAFLQEMVVINTGKADSTEKFIGVISKAAGLDPKKPVRLSEATYTEPGFAVQLVMSFDRVGMHLHSLLVLRDAVSRLKNDDSARLLARRTWQAGLAAELVTQFTGPGSNPASLHPDILGFLGLARLDLGQRPEALEVLNQLRAQERNAMAQSWAKLLSALLEKTDLRESLLLIDAAIKQAGSEPVLGYYRAEVLARLGRVDEAREVWKGVYKSPAADGWAAPAVRIAESYLDEGRVDDGVRAADDATRRFPMSTAAKLTVLRAQASLIEAGRIPPDPTAALTRLDDITHALVASAGGQSTPAIDGLVLPARVALLSAIGRKPEATAILEAVVARPESLSPGVARRFAAVSAKAGLGMEDRLLTAAGSGAGGTDPGTVLTRALVLDSTGKREAAVKLMDEAIANCQPNEKPPLAIARAQFFDSVGHADALATWKQLLQDYPDSLPAHLAALKSAAAAADLAFVDQTAARVTQLGGSDPDRPSVEVRMARCRALLHGSPTAKNRDEALGLLRAMILEAPKLAARDLLIDALLMDDPGESIKADYPAAIEQLIAAAAVAPNRPPYTLRLAAALQRQGRTRDAATELSKLALDDAAERRDRLEAVDRLSSLREIDTALRAIDAMIGSTQEPPVDLLTRRAVLLASLRRDREAGEAYRRVLARPIDDIDAIVAIAAGLDAIGDTEGASLAIGKLEQPGISPFMKSVALGRLAVTKGDYDTARTQFTRATELAPDDARTWAALARLSLQRGDFAKAEAAALSGLERLPGNPDLAVVLQQARLASQAGESADLSGLADALDKVPGMERRAAALRAVERAKHDAQLDDAATLVRLSDEFADDPTTQIFVGRRLTSLKPPRFTEAAALLRRAANRFPADAGIQEQATRTLAGIGDWESALTTATAWRALTRSPDADLAVGETQLALGRFRPALEAVGVLRLPPPPTIAPDDRLSLGTLNVRVRALVSADDNKAAYQALQPYLPSAPVRTVIGLPTAADLIKTLDEARRWVEQIAAAAKPDDRDERMAIATAWARLSERFPAAKAELLRQAVTTTDSLIASEATADARVYDLRARLLAASGDKAGAVAAGRAAVAKDPQSVTSLLGLANLLLGTESDPAEAAALARRAAEVSPDAPAPLIVLAAAQLEQADRRSAANDQPGRDAARRDAAATLAKFNALKIDDFGSINDMAVMAERMEDLPAAIALYERAIALPQAPTGRNLAIVKNNLAFAMYMRSTGAGSKEPLGRAKSMIDEAIQIAQLGPFYDTLGAIDAAMGDRAGAIAAYRKALAADEKSVGSSIGLAHLLAGGTPDERAEASKLIQSVDAAVAAGETVSELRKGQLQEAKSKLAAR
jgi:tetratricopeptide (TPR) repeat protein